MPRGRRPGASTTRARILATARRKFADVGYERCTLRAIAADAQVDPALVMHFFGSKQQLFREAVGWPIDPSQVLGRVLSAADGDLGKRLARTFVELWEDAVTRDALLAVLRGALTQEDAARLVRATFNGGLVKQVARRIGGRERELRVELAAAQLVGMAVLRHVIRMEPLASASVPALVRRLAPSLNQQLGESP
jgi:AcrR family transcriptional regulator